ncbi:hypothetical protein B0I35DRAFT_477132 [Stachybotrys elegans]|uniref:Uncharacterized protein n=1 Tax=Stachybotrys elegans TaxID=80388 RepID=A0A8K0WTW4_9HYPO|nr:hypothetical protein B0I35DRAFT_477132 [Stachybotrys elegans]
MPATDALQPPLSDGAKAVVKLYGSWTHFMQCFGLKPWDMDDVEEAKAIAESFAADPN